MDWLEEEQEARWEEASSSWQSDSWRDTEPGMMNEDQWLQREAYLIAMDKRYRAPAWAEVMDDVVYAAWKRDFQWKHLAIEDQ